VPARRGSHLAAAPPLRRDRNPLRRLRSSHRLVIVALAGLSAAACGGQPAPSTASSADPTPSAAYHPVIDSTGFTEKVTNPYYPLAPGTTHVYQGAADGAPETDEVIVTKDTKVIVGVRCVVVHHTVNRAGALAEDTYDWYAQDRGGNVWYFGESTVAHNADGTSSREGSWEAGVDGAQPGLIMEGAPRVGDTYRQEYYRGHAEDFAKVLGLTEAVTVPVGSFRDAVLTEEFTPLEPDKVEHKYFARGMGLVSLQMTKGGSEELKLVRVTTG
jgi:hypothetical protein